MATLEKEPTAPACSSSDVPEALINPSGHEQELERNFSILTLGGMAITTGNAWAAMGGSLAVAVYNGGPPGVIYQFIAVCLFYGPIYASIAELASSIPSSGGVYHWSSVVGGRYGRICGWLAGWWNCLAWISAVASISAILGTQAVSMYSIFHPTFSPQPWHVFVSYLACTWLSCAIVLFGNKHLPLVGNVGLLFILAGFFVTILVCLVMPKVRGDPYATSDVVWREWTNGTGYSSNSLTFLIGMLNGAYTIGSTDCVTHLAEEIPRPSRNIPRIMAAQYIIGFSTGLLFVISVFYSVDDLPTALSSVPIFPLAGLYKQAVGTSGGALGLLIVVFLPSFITCIGCYVTAGRTLWTLSRDNAPPFSNFLRQIHPTLRNPFNATLVCAMLSTLMGCIYVGSRTAFNALIGSYVIFSTLSYLGAILPHLLSKRRNIKPGAFWMDGMTGFIVNGISCLYIVVFIVFFSFPYVMPVDAGNMNYTALIVGGLTMFIVGFWFWRQGDYKGPRMVNMEEVDAPAAI